MSRPRRPSASTEALRAARRAWRTLHLDASATAAAAQRALELAQRHGDRAAEALARTTRGLHALYFSTPAEADAELQQAEALYGNLGDRAGQILAAAGRARALWRIGQARQALERLLPLRDEGVRLLQHAQRGVLLNAIAGCWSTLGRSDLAFAYMFEALGEAGPRRGRGFDAALHCNLAHELMQLGDYESALDHVQQGLERAATLRHPRLESVLRINRVTCLFELGRAAEALPDVQHLMAMPATPAGRGTTLLHFESLAIAALRAGETELGEQLVALAEAQADDLPDVRIELSVARALRAAAHGRLPQALQALAACAALVQGEAGDGGEHLGGLRTRCLHAQVSSELHEAAGDAAAALREVRRWQCLQAQRARLASQARYQAAALRTELLKLQHRLEENEAKRVAIERARAELAAANTALSRKIAEVQALQTALQQQATQDALTGLFNRRHLNESLPGQLALAGREQWPLAAVVIDLDHFKQVNDRHGHGVGDQVLAGFGRLLQERLRRSDLAFRYGGEEFCLLMPHTGRAAAQRLMQALLAAWRDCRFALEDGGALRDLGFSAGVADSLECGAEPGALLALADQRLLHAKRLGRGRVVAAAPVQNVY